MTLLPSLVVSDIGPVLSLTGAVGGSCISYIGPGCVYLGVNGEDFLNNIGGWLDSWRKAKGYATSSNAGVSEGDLPVEGNANLQQDVEQFSYNSIVSGSKPIWYYLGLFPIWVSIANRGATNMQRKIEAANAVTVGGAADETKEVLPAPTRWDFCVCIFFILFGTVSAVAGVVSNVWVQLNDLDEVEY